ncbi:DUF4911 domain-containing protein [Desulfosporosinus meridiei]|uniref:DUF4911 domain-containing protein n=1 Tax=Desulfosporosinus meridiei (strain ATCC BAA-275 / DSM 13257 / KCTC 12902 / NCIMB 13706 / S10) TaxID=768704 RepID=J7IS29_DESMD|nr:DUF4911 domain-containing protein [Desulfosporosinus meridiei]AFQ42994.1 hypothetical protein Desmer_0970 [Desulfosporosinus meridiei DSM 13257]
MNFDSIEHSSPPILGLDVVVKARLERVEMQTLDKLVEGLGHLGIVTTTDRALGEVMIQTTKQCWPDLKKAIEQMPFEIEFI